MRKRRTSTRFELARAFGPGRDSSGPLRRLGDGAQRPRSPLGDFARTPAGSSEQAERSSPRRWSVRSRHTSVQGGRTAPAGPPRWRGRDGGGATGRLRPDGTCCGLGSGKPVDLTEQLRRRCGEGEDSHSHRLVAGSTTTHTPPRAASRRAPRSRFSGSAVDGEARLPTSASSPRFVRGKAQSYGDPPATAADPRCRGTRCVRRHGSQSADLRGNALKATQAHGSIG